MLQTHENPKTRPQRRSSTTHADSKLKGESPFSRYRPEKERAVRMPEVVENATLRQLKDAWRRFVRAAYEGEEIEHTDEPSMVYYTAIRILKAIDYSAKDVEKFSVALAEFQDDVFDYNSFVYNAGLFLSALIGNCPDSDFVIHTRHLTNPPRYIGFRNTKNVTVEGSVEDYSGEKMASGRITINGDAGVGLGHDMEGGEIHLEGRCKLISASANLQYGKIFHRGKEIHPYKWGQ